MVVIARKTRQYHRLHIVQEQLFDYEFPRNFFDWLSMLKAWRDERHG